MDATKTAHLNVFWRTIIAIGKAMMGIALAALAVMIITVCADVIMRIFGRSLKGSYDVVCIAGALTAAGVLPLCTAKKGHVAIEYFFQKLGKTWRFIVDALMRLTVAAGLACAVRACIVCGIRYLRNGEVTNTIEIPIFWVPWFMAFAFLLTLLIVLWHLTHPGKRLVRV